MGKISRRTNVKAEDLAAAIKTALYSEYGFVPTHASMQGLKRAGGRVALVYDYGDFEGMLSKLSGKSMLVFLGSNDFQKRVSDKLGIHSLQTSILFHPPKPIGKEKPFRLYQHHNFRCFAQFLADCHYFCCYLLP
jgi:hypothetical protein